MILGNVLLLHVMEKFGLPFYANWRFSHDVTKIEARKSLILLRFYFHDVEEQLKTSIYANFWSEWVLGFVMDYARISKLLREAAYTWRPRELSCKCKCIRIRNWPLPIGAFQNQCKQIVINKHNLAKNPNWREADQLAIYKRRREVELGATENNIS